MCSAPTRRPPSVEHGARRPGRSGARFEAGDEQRQRPARRARDRDQHPLVVPEAHVAARDAARARRRRRRCAGEHAGGARAGPQRTDGDTLAIELLGQRGDRGAERLDRLVGDAGADLARAGGGVQHAGGDLRRDVELDDQPRVDADRRADAVARGDREALRARRADLGHQLGAAPPRRPRRRRRTTATAGAAAERHAAEPDALDHRRVADVARRVRRRRSPRAAARRRPARPAPMNQRPGMPASWMPDVDAVARDQRDDARARARPQPPATRTWTPPSSGSGRSGGCRR